MSSEVGSRPEQALGKLFAQDDFPTVDISCRSWQRRAEGLLVIQAGCMYLNAPCQLPFLI